MTRALDVDALEGWFLHTDLILAMLDDEAASALLTGLPPKDYPFAQSHWNSRFQRALATILQTSEVSALAVHHLRGTLDRGQLVWLDQAINFKGLREATEATWRGEESRATFSASLDTDPDFRVTGDYNPRRVTGPTAGGMLSGRKRRYLLGYVSDLQPGHATVRPAFIGERWATPAGTSEPVDLRDLAQVWPQQVDQFAGIDFTQRLRKQALAALRDIPEKEVKQWFAEIIGEPDVPKDWGGEQCDLWTDRFTIDGQRYAAAIAFKGPAAFHPMTIADLGKNGDQIDRLADTAATLLVVQHCHSITAPVANMLRAYATSTDQPRRYLTIDGYNTLRILRHFGYLRGFGRPTSPTLAKSLASRHLAAASCREAGNFSQRARNEFITKVVDVAVC